MEPRFGTGAVLVGLLPEQDPAVLIYAVPLAGAMGVSDIGGYGDPVSFLIEGDHSGNPLGRSLNGALDPEDEAASAVRELEPILQTAAQSHGVQYSLRVLGGDPDMPRGRLAQAASVSVIVVGARRPGLLAGVNEVLTGSVVRKLLATQHVPALAIPRVDARPPLHG
ncbi:MAG: universal stress protein [Specibacter sp.]